MFLDILLACVALLALFASWLFGALFGAPNVRRGGYLMGWSDRRDGRPHQYAPNDDRNEHTTN